MVTVLAKSKKKKYNQSFHIDSFILWYGWRLEELKNKRLTVCRK